MNIKKRLIISNTIIVIVPIVITIVTILGILFVSLKLTGNKTNYEVYKQRMYIQSQLVTLKTNILKQDIEDNKLNTILSQQLSRVNGTFVIIKSHKIIANPNDINKIDIERCLELSKENTIDKNIKINNIPHIIETITLTSKVNSNEIVLMLAPIEKEVSLFNIFVITAILVFVICFVITNIAMSYILSKRIIQPIKLLKKATNEISNGNLDCSIAEEGDQEIQELCQGFEAMRVQLKDSIIMKMRYDTNRKELVSSISHDLKTPITSIKGYVEGILDGVANTPEKKEHYLKTIYSKAEHIDHMIDDLLLYSKLDLKQIPFNFTKVNIIEYFNYCICESEQELKKDNIEICLNNELKASKFVIIDPERLRRVILNIIENSRKYMNKKQGKIIINLRETASSIIIEIRDNGSGIDKNDVNKIFNRFYRTDAARSGAKGSGLGLAIAKQIVEGHSGRIWAISHGNEGTSIIISLQKTT